jgi:D-glycero-D-manno-heptose 1,7-bisphosphate phosphatase
MAYYPEHDLVDSPFKPSQLALVEGAGEALRNFRKMGYKLIVVSNQPGVAKGHFTVRTHNLMRSKVRELLAKEGVELDAEYYCFHHPQARVEKYRVDCECRKPKPGMLIRAAEEQGISLPDSLMIGDGLQDIIAGKAAGTKTILVANMNSLIGRLMAERNVVPDYVARNLTETIDLVKRCNGSMEIGKKEELQQ